MNMGAFYDYVDENNLEANDQHDAMKQYIIDDDVINMEGLLEGMKIHDRVLDFVFVEPDTNIILGINISNELSRGVLEIPKNNWKKYDKFFLEKFNIQPQMLVGMEGCH